jgi:hypothetical protein
MLPVVLLLFSVFTMCQFGIYYWRALVAGVAAAPISDRVRVAAQFEEHEPAAADFGEILSLIEITPGLGGTSGMGPVRAYFAVVSLIGRVVPPLSAWSDREKVVCSRYAAALLDRRLERVEAFAVASRSI